MVAMSSRASDYGKRGGDKQAAKSRKRDALGVEAKVTGIPANKGNAYSGNNQAIYDVNKKSWEDIEHLAVHVADSVGLCQEVRAMANRNLTVNMLCPSSYGEELLRMHRDSARGFVMFRMYVVPRDAFMAADPDEDEEDEGDEGDAEPVGDEDDGD